MSTTENASLLDDIEYANSYVSCTDDAFYYVDIYKIFWLFFSFNRYF